MAPNPPLHVMTVFGTRPEAIKMAPIVHALDAAGSSIRQTVCVTAQHREMLDQVLNLFGITPDIDLNLMMPGQTLAQLTSRILMAMSDVIEEHKPDIVLVHGDTSTTFATSLAAFYNQVAIGHIEAGLRTGNMYHPWPEEGNRKLTDAIADLYFAPTIQSETNLLTEGVDPERIVITGNTVIDALLWVREHLQKLSVDETHALFENISGADSTFLDLLTSEDQRSTPVVLITGHRRENFGQGFEQIISAINRLAVRHPQTHFVYPVHLNPNVQKPVYAALSEHKNVHLLAPLDYAPFVFLMDRARLVLTDSGGIQEEAPSLGKPVLVMRETTERPEAVQANTAKLVGTDADTIVDAVTLLLEDDEAYAQMAQAKNPFGDGTAAMQTVSRLLEWNKRKPLKQDTFNRDHE